jgi:hypothetical protein
MLRSSAYETECYNIFKAVWNSTQRGLYCSKDQATKPYGYMQMYYPSSIKLKQFILPKGGYPEIKHHICYTIFIIIRQGSPTNAV